jgi:hypothetical protein
MSFISKSKNTGKRIPKIDWERVTVIYEDSEGDLNVISENEDLGDAFSYSQMKQLGFLNCSIVDKDMYKKIRDEQEESDLNQSQTWLSNDAYR